MFQCCTLVLHTVLTASCHPVSGFDHVTHGFQKCTAYQVGKVTTRITIGFVQKHLPVRV